MARPSKLTPELKERFLKHLRLGITLETACAGVGIDYSTFRRWMLEGEVHSKGRFREFCEDTHRAIAESEVILLNRISESSKRDWRAAAWILERRFSQNWSASAKIQLQVEAELDRALDKLQSKLSPSAYRELLEGLAADE